MNAFEKAILSANKALGEVFGEDITFAPRRGAAAPLRAVRSLGSTFNALGFRDPNANQTLTFDLPDTIARPGTNDRVIAQDGEWFVKGVSECAIDGIWRVTVEADE